MPAGCEPRPGPRVGVGGVIPSLRRILRIAFMPLYAPICADMRDYAFLARRFARIPLSCTIPPVGTWAPCTAHSRSARQRILRIVLPVRRFAGILR